MLLCSAYFQWGSPIYSAESVRFHLGHPKCPMDDTLGEPLDGCADDKFIWTYSSPEFPMAQVCHACFPFFNLSDVAVIFFFFLNKSTTYINVAMDLHYYFYSFVINSISGACIKNHSSVNYQLAYEQVQHSIFRHSRWICPSYFCRKF